MLQNIAAIGSFVAAVAAFIASAILVLMTRKRLEEGLKKHIEYRSAAHESLVRTLIRTIKPRVVHCSKPEEVKREAIELIRSAIDTKKTRDLKRSRANSPSTDFLAEESETNSASKKSAGDYQTESFPEEIDFITFYGAADLSGEDKDKDYREALASAFQHELRIRRYICLYDKTDLKDRDPEIKLKYFQWLARQYDTLASTPGFQLVHNPRVPQWWANSATLLTNEAVMEIKGNGTAAVSVRDHSIAATIRESLREAREEAAESNKKVFSGDKARLADFEKHIVDGCAENNLSLKEVAEGTHFFAKLAAAHDNESIQF